MSDVEYVYDPKEQTMVFSTGTRRHVRVAYSDGKVWYCATDIAKLIGYRDFSKVAINLNCEVKPLRVPNVTASQKRITICNCISKYDVIRLISQPEASPEAHPEACNWIRNVVIPQAERQFPVNHSEEPAGVIADPIIVRLDAIAAALDKIIAEAVLLKRDIQYR